METIICGICTDMYDEKRRPILLPCGDTICNKCVSKLMYAEKSFFCPFDRSFIKLNECKINFRVQRIAENSSKKFPEIASDLKSSAKKRRGKSRIRLKDLTNLCDEFSKNQREILDDNIQTHNIPNYSNYLSPQSKTTLTTVSKTPSKNNNYKNGHISPTNSPTQLGHHENPRGKRKQRRKKNYKRKSKVFVYSYMEAALLTASVIGGLYLLNKLSLGRQGVPKASSIFVAIKEGAEAVSTGLFNLLHYSKSSS